MSDLYRLLNEEQHREVKVRGTSAAMRLLTARELLRLRASLPDSKDDLETALHGSAALVAATLRRDGAPVFDDADQVLDTLCAEEINALCAAYRAWSEEIDPGIHSDTEVIETLKKA